MASFFPVGGGGEGASVNDGIDQDKFTLHYITVDQVICLVSKVGMGPSWPNLM